jgi:hypothetical protein
MNHSAVTASSSFSHPELRRGLVEEIDHLRTKHSSGGLQRLPSWLAERNGSVHATIVTRDLSRMNSRSWLRRRVANRIFAVLHAR